MGQLKLTLLALAASILTASGRIEASVIAEYQASADPVTEGWGYGSNFAPANTGAIPNDLGLPAWFIAGTGGSSQATYGGGAPSDPQTADIASNGFILTLVARVLPGVGGNTYTPSNQIIIGNAYYGNGTVRYQIDLGLDASGDTVVVLPNTLNTETGGYVYDNGASYTLTGSGSSYHTYELVENPTTLLANLYVDGIEEIQGYAGDTSFVNNTVAWSEDSGGQANFNFVSLSSGVPEPASLVLFGVGALGLLARRRRFC